MKKAKEYAYGFNMAEELTMYSNIGQKKSPYHNYSEWHGYVYEKYGECKYKESTLINFLHYLKREKRRSAEKRNFGRLFNSISNSIFFNSIYACIFNG